MFNMIEDNNINKLQMVWVGNVSRNLKLEQFWFSVKRQVQLELTFLCKEELFQGVQLSCKTIVVVIKTFAEKRSSSLVCLGYTNFLVTNALFMFWL